MRVLHIVDIVTEASSFLRAWIPALRGLGALFEDTFAIVDRDQGGGAVLAAEGVRLHSLAKIGAGLFLEAMERGRIGPDQYEIVRRFIEAPETFMRGFLRTHPGFLETTIAAGGKNAEKARLAIQKGLV